MPTLATPLTAPLFERVATAVPAAGTTAPAWGPAGAGCCAGTGGCVQSAGCVGAHVCVYSHESHEYYILTLTLNIHNELIHL